MATGCGPGRPPPPGPWGWCCDAAAVHRAGRGRPLTRPIDLAGFEAKFLADPDPWRTHTDRREAVKRSAILHALGHRAWGRVLELGSGNGSNSRALAHRALRLDACEGTASGAALTRRALHGTGRARAHRLELPGRFPVSRYDAVVIAELLYYLDERRMRRLAQDVARALRPGGCLVLAHHHIRFDDAAQPPPGVHSRFLRASGRRWHRRHRHRTGHWTVEAVVRALPPECGAGPVSRRR